NEDAAASSGVPRYRSRSYAAPLDKALGVMFHVVCDERRDEIIAVIVALLSPQRQLRSGLATSLLEQLWLQLLGQKLVRRALIDQDGVVVALGCKQLRGIIRAPGFAIGTEIASKRLLTPRALHGCADWRKSRHGTILVSVPEGDHQGTVSAHGMAEDALPVFQRDAERVHELGQLTRHIAVHAIALRPGLFCRVDVKACRKPEIPTLVVARVASLTGTRVRRDEHDAELRRQPLRARLDHESLFRARQTRQVVQHRHAPFLCLRRDVHRKAHLRSALARLVRVETLRTAEA